YGNWKISEDNTNKVFEIDNEKSSDYAGLDIGSTDWKNYMVEYRVKMLHHTSGAPEVILYFRTNYDGTDGYFQALTPYYNDISSGKHFNGSNWQDIIDRSYSFIFGQWYHVRVQAVGSSIKIFIEDKLIIDRTDTQFSSGALTLQVGPGAHILL
ncbi:MAG: DUF1080 domain-containing protein, partial [Chloroflexi bacterium]|nr:DUF1080 domain-containing protein [Chloroflexota bacterium]